MTEEQRTARNAEIICLAASRVPHRDIAEKFNISAARVGQIARKNGVGWTAEELRAMRRAQAIDMNRTPEVRRRSVSTRKQCGYTSCVGRKGYPFKDQADRRAYRKMREIYGVEYARKEFGFA